jgi:ATP-dependent phosphoenolpyruvate carboxykinase
MVLKYGYHSQEYECAHPYTRLGLRKEKGTAISNVGALLVYSGEKTGRSPKDRAGGSEPRIRKQHRLGRHQYRNG